MPKILFLVIYLNINIHCKHNNRKNKFMILHWYKCIFVSVLQFRMFIVHCSICKFLVCQFAKIFGHHIFVVMCLHKFRLYYFAILWLKYDPTITITYCSFIETREIAIVGNIRLVRLLDLTADFGVETNAKLTPIFKLREKRITGI